MLPIIYDFLISIPLFFFIVSVVLVTSKMKNVWRNRKYIHFSSVPAVIAYMYLFKEPYVFSFFSFFFSFLLLYKHKKSKLLNWFQIKKNLGEVWFTLSFGILSLVFWNFDRIAGGTIMLFMSVGDAVTGIIRSFFVKKRKKHFSGSIAMALTVIPLAYLLLGWRGIVTAVVATLAEYQNFIDDNIAIPLFSSLTYFLLCSSPTL